MFPVDDDEPIRPRANPRERTCPDCEVSMDIDYDGEFGTRYVCPNCYVYLTVPPKVPRQLR